MLDSEDDTTAEFEGELSVYVDTMVVVKSVICDVEWFVAMVVTRLVVTVTGKLRLSTMVVELSTGREKLCPEDDGTAELGIVEEAPAEDEDSEVGTPDDGTPEDGVPEDGITEDGTPEDGTPEDGTPEDGIPEDDETEDGTPEEGTPLELWHHTISTPRTSVTRREEGGDIPRAGICHDQ